MTFFVDQMTTETECLENVKLVSWCARRFGKGQWSFIGPGSEKKWYCISEDSPQGVWDKTAEKMLVEFAESGCPIFRATSPLSRGQLKSKGHGKLSIHYAADLETVETIFRIIVSANQLSLYGAVAEICEEHESLHERTGRPVVMGQSNSSLVLSVIKTEIPLDCDDPMNQDLFFPARMRMRCPSKVHSQPQPETERWSNKEAVNALAAEHASTALHLRRLAALTLFCKMKGEAWALALASAAKNLAVSSLHRPPTLQRRPLRQFGIGSFFPAACLHQDRSAMVCSTKPGGTVTSQRRHQRRVDRQLCPVPQGEPVRDHFQATWAAKSISRTGMLVDTRLGLLPLGTPVLPRIQEGTSSSPRPLPQHTLHDDGQTNQAGGHIGRCAWTEEKACGVSCTTGGGKAEDPTCGLGRRQCNQRC